MSPSSIDNDLAEVADMFDSIRDHRVIVAAATLDELDRKPSDEVDIADVSVSVADTERADNTHPYLMRYADVYAHSQEFSDPDEAGNTKFIKINNFTHQGEFRQGEVVIYHDKDTNMSYEATIIDVHYDERKQPHYDLMFKGGNNENDNEKEDTVRLSVKDDSIKQQPKTLEAVSETSSYKETNSVKCVNFDINPTQLFVAMYDGDWEAAQKRLDSHPEEASVWVARYNTSSDDIKVYRWRLLPLHLCVALGGSDDDDDDDDDDAIIDHDKAPAPGVPDDEKDELDQKENKKQPPRTLLAALLEKYPQATQCTDDQNLIPLHSAIRGNASLPVIKDLLDADPASVNYKDSRGRNAHMLAKKVFGKRCSENKAREKKYARLTELLHLAGTHPDAKVKKDQQQYESRLNKLEHENLSLRRDNALLRTRCARNEDLLEKLVQKLQEYQAKMDGDCLNGIKSNDQANIKILASVYQEKEEELSPSVVPAIDDNRVAENWKVAFDANSCMNYYFNKKTRVVTWVKPTCLEEHQEEAVNKDVEDGGGNRTENKILGGKGAYAKRIERHIQTTMSYENSEEVLATPVSVRTGATEATTPETWEGRNRALELESFDEEDEDKANKPFMADLLEVSAGEIVHEISSSTIFRLSSHTEKDRVPFDVGNDAVSFANAEAFSYADMVKVGDAEKVSSEKNRHEQQKPKVSFKDVPATEKKVKPVNPAIIAEKERLRRKFSEEI
ncbi:hypothetical protein ACHAXM_010100 [Skeletonema potamos]